MWYNTLKWLARTAKGRTLSAPLPFITMRELTQERCVVITIPLPKSKRYPDIYATVIDDWNADLTLLDWRYHTGRDNRFYVVRYVKHENKRQIEFLHRVILSRKLGRPLEKGEFVDHRDNDPFNNQESNLRLATHIQNGQNRKLNKNNTSGYKGVCWHKTMKKWVAMIRVNGKQEILGFFDDPREAGDAYKESAKKHFGEFARFE